MTKLGEWLRTKGETIALNTENKHKALQHPLAEASIILLGWEKPFNTPVMADYILGIRGLPAVVAQYGVHRLSHEHTSDEAQVQKNKIKAIINFLHAQSVEKGHAESTIHAAPLTARAMNILSNAKRAAQPDTVYKNMSVQLELFEAKNATVASFTGTPSPMGMLERFNPDDDEISYLQRRTTMHQPSGTGFMPEEPLEKTLNNMMKSLFKVQPLIIPRAGLLLTHEILMEGWTIGRELGMQYEDIATLADTHVDTIFGDMQKLVTNPNA